MEKLERRRTMRIHDSNYHLEFIPIGIEGQLIQTTLNAQIGQKRIEIKGSISINDIQRLFHNLDGLFAGEIEEEQLTFLEERFVLTMKKEENFVIEIAVFDQTEETKSFINPNLLFEKSDRMPSFQTNGYLFFEIEGNQTELLEWLNEWNI